MLHVTGISDTRSTGSVLPLVFPMHPSDDTQLAQTSMAISLVKVLIYFQLVHKKPLPLALWVSNRPCPGSFPSLLSPCPSTIQQLKKAVMPAFTTGRTPDSARARVHLIGEHPCLISVYLVRGSPLCYALSILTTVILALILSTPYSGLLPGPSNYSPNLRLFCSK